jgi:hypothetical protein
MKRTQTEIVTYTTACIACLFLIVLAGCADPTDNTSPPISPIFEENFDDADLSTGNTWTITGGYLTTFPVTSTVTGGDAPSSGTNCLQSNRTAPDGANEGYNIDLNNITPSYISFYMRVDSNDKVSLFMAYEDTDQQIFRVIFTDTGHVWGNATELDAAINIDTWYFVELKNIDWTNQTLDFYASNGTDPITPLIAVPFSNPASGLKKLILSSADNGATAWYDEIIMY